MIIECKNGKEIEKYIGEEFHKCLYIYLDYKQYGTENENVLFYSQVIDNKITAMMLLYYNSGLHVYSKDDDCNYGEIANFIMEKKPIAIFGEGNLIRNLNDALGEKDYSVEFGSVWKVENFHETDSSNVEKAKESDFDEITKLLLTDPDIGSSYTFENLKEQLLGRNKSGISRNYVIKEDGKIIAHSATGVETDKVAISSLTIVDENHRRMGLATKILNTSFNDLNSEGKKIYFVNYTEESTNLYIKLGCIVACEWGKLYSKREDMSND